MKRSMTTVLAGVAAVLLMTIVNHTTATAQNPDVAPASAEGSLFRESVTITTAAPDAALEFYSVAGVVVDPQSAQLHAAESKLAQSARKLLAQYSSSEDTTERTKIRGQLRGALETQFDLQRKHRERELVQLEEKLKKLNDLLRKRNEARQTIIDRRLDQLTVDADGLGWQEPAGGMPGLSGTWSSAATAYYEDAARYEVPPPTNAVAPEQ